MDPTLSRNLQLATDQLVAAAIIAPGEVSRKLFELVASIGALVHDLDAMVEGAPGAPPPLSQPAGPHRLAGTGRTGRPGHFSGPLGQPHSAPEPPPKLVLEPTAVGPRGPTALHLWIEAAAIHAEAVELAAGPSPEAAVYPVHWAREQKVLKPVFDQLGTRELFRRWGIFLLDASILATSNRTIQFFASCLPRWAVDLPALPSSNLDGGRRDAVAQATKSGQRFARPLPGVSAPNVLEKLGAARALVEQSAALVAQEPHT